MDCVCQSCLSCDTFVLYQKSARQGRNTKSVFWRKVGVERESDLHEGNQIVLKMCFHVFPFVLIKFVMLQGCSLSNKQWQKQPKSAIYLSSCFRELIYLEHCQCCMFAEYEVLLCWTKQCKLVFVRHLCGPPGNTFHFSFVLKWIIFENFPKILSKIFSSIRQCVGCSQVQTLHLDSSSMGGVFKEDIYAKADSEMKKVISLAFIIHFQNDELKKISVTGTIQLLLTFIFPYYWLI